MVVRIIKRIIGILDEMGYTAGTGVATALMNVQWPTALLPSNLTAFGFTGLFQRTDITTVAEL